MVSVSPKDLEPYAGLGGLHHVTAITGQASENVSFYTRVLGLRLVKKTVNQDDVSAYHLFYGDEVGRPGTEVTFFDWPQSGPNESGTGTISSIALRVPGRAALEWWARKFDTRGIVHGDIENRRGQAVMTFTDPEGQRLELIDDGGAPGGTPWKGSPVPAEVAIRGLYGVTITVAQLDATAALLTKVLDFRQTGEYESPEMPGHRVIVFETGSGGPGTQLRVVVGRDMSRGVPGIGGVHHVAFRTPNDAQHRQWRERLAKAGVGVTPVINRYYFKSIYFREPGGVLFEIATDGPGFTADESADRLGERLSLPPFLEPQRSTIEAHLRPITVPSVH